MIELRLKRGIKMVNDYRAPDGAVSLFNGGFAVLEYREQLSSLSGWGNWAEISLVDPPKDSDIMEIDDTAVMKAGQVYQTTEEKASDADVQKPAIPHPALKEKQSISLSEQAIEEINSWMHDQEANENVDLTKLVMRLALKALEANQLVAKEESSDTTADYGKELILDLHGCNPANFTREIIERFLEALCDTIGMERQDLHWWDYLDTPELKAKAESHLVGTSVIQFITTSNITIHTLDLMNRMYFNLFSCKDFDADHVASFTRVTFGGEIVNKQIIRRM